MNITVGIIPELMKLRRSKIFLITIGLFIFIPIMMGLMMYVSQHPEIASKIGIAGTKAKLFTDNTWKGYFEMLNQIIAALGVIGFGFVTAWVFGSEYIQHTITDLLALPVTRTSIVAAKLFTSALWCVILAIVLFLSSLAMGFLIDIPGWSQPAFYQSIKIFFATSGFTVMLIPIIAFISSASRGIFAPLGFVILTLIMAQFIAIMGLGPYFPWAIPGIYTVSSSEPGMHLTLASYYIIVLTSISGILGTIAWWRYADQS